MAKEKYVNQAYLKVVESGANTLTFSKLETGVSIYEKVGWLINRLDYSIDLTDTALAAKDDAVYYGISVSDQITNVGLINSAVVDRNTIKRIDLGTAASGFLIRTPFEKDFSGLEGGGLLIPPNPIYIFVIGVSAGAAFTVECRMFYTVVQLKTEDFWELVEQRRMIGV